MSVTKIGFNTQQNVIPNIGSSSKRQIPFRANEDKVEISKTTTTPEETKKPRSLTAKKWGVGIASVFAPGTGQLVNSETGKGIALLGGFIAAWLLNLRSSSAGKLITSIAILGLAIYSCIDAVKHVKPDKE